MVTSSAPRGHSGLIQPLFSSVSFLSNAKKAAMPGIRRGKRALLLRANGPYFVYTFRFPV